MRDPLNWSVPLFRAFGIQVRLHILYIIITFSLLWRAGVQSNNSREVIELCLIWIVLLFVIILLHEFGHCFAARQVNGDAKEILMWPLGGLAFCDVPHTPRANFVCVAGGPAVNVLICLVTGAVLLAFGYVPPTNPFNPDHLGSPEMYNFSDGQTYVPPYHGRVIRIDDKSNSLIYEYAIPVEGRRYIIDPDKRRPYEVREATVAHFGESIAWTARVFYLSWVLFLFNLLPAFPLDGGRMLQCYLWARSDYRRATTIACYSGYVVAALMVIVSIGNKEPMTGFLAIFIFFSAYQQLTRMEMEGEGVFGYDFSQGYTSLNRDEDDDTDRPPWKPKEKKLGPLGRWLKARRDRRKQLEEEERAAEQSRMDELLDKVHREGLQSLSDEERKFMNRVSAKYKNRS